MRWGGRGEQKGGGGGRESGGMRLKEQRVALGLAAARRESERERSEGREGRETRRVSHHNNKGAIALSLCLSLCCYCLDSGEERRWSLLSL